MFRRQYQCMNHPFLIAYVLNGDEEAQSCRNEEQLSFHVNLEHLEGVPVMKYALNRFQLAPKLGLLPILVLFSIILAACGDVAPTVEAPVQPSYDLSLSVDIDTSSTRENIQARYGGDIIVWRSEAGFAVLGLHNSLSTQSVDGEAELNKDQVIAPEAQVTASSVWGGGRNIWSGGRNIWSGGTNITSEPTLSWQNTSVWEKIELGEGLASAPHEGAGVKVAVIDSGLDLHHPAFQGRLAPAHAWQDFVDGDAYPQEERSADNNDNNYGHGTGVAGVVLQIAPKATILPLRVLDSEGTGDVTDVAAAIDQAVTWGADIINLSLGTDEDSDVLNRMIAYAAEHKVFVVASSGNTGDERITYPARNAKQPGSAGAYLVSVGSVQTSDELSILSTFSTYGDALELTAPGEYIYTAFPENQVGYWSGTSFSAPMVAGTLALMIGEDEEDKVAHRLEWIVNSFDLKYIPLNVKDFMFWTY